MEFQPALRATKVLNLSEAEKALTYDRSKSLLVSWMTDYIDLIVAKIKAKGIKEIDITLNGRDFVIRPMNYYSKSMIGDRDGNRYWHLSPVDGFIPCATFTVEALERAIDGSPY